MAKRIRTINTESLQKTAKTGGCGECQTSCQSACKTSCTVGNQVYNTYFVWYIFMTLFITFSVEMWYNYLESSI